LSLFFLFLLITYYELTYIAQASTPGAGELVKLVEHFAQPPVSEIVMAGMAVGKRLRRRKDQAGIDDDDDASGGGTYVETHVKHMKTMVPVDPKAARMAKKRARADARTRSSKRLKKE
jgi:hypothetical protein